MFRLIPLVQRVSLVKPSLLHPFPIQSIRFSSTKSAKITPKPVLKRPPSLLHISTIRNPLSLSSRRKKIKGRGGKSKRAGRGNKGYKARNPVSSRVPAFAGGQTRITKAFPTFGNDTNKYSKGKLNLRPVSLDKLQLWITLGRLNPSKTITLKDLVVSGIAGKVKDGITLLASGHQYLTTPVKIQVTRASQSAIAAVEAVGGKVETVYSDQKIVHALLHPEKYMSGVSEEALIVPGDKRLVEYYLTEERRGTLASLKSGVSKREDLVKELVKKTRDTAHSYF